MLRPLIAAGIVAAACVAPASADVLYSYDDGQLDSAVGPPSSFPENPEMGWGNYFEAQPQGELIHTIQVSIGPTMPNLGPVTVWLFDDPDNDFNPGNAVPLTSATLTPTTIGGSFFTEFAIEPTQVSGGFFVMAATVAVAGEDRPAAQDTTSPVPTDRSWIIYNPARLGIDVDDLAGNALFSPAAAITPFDGAWMVRAVGSPIPEPASAGALIGLSGLALLRRRRR